MLPTRLSKHCDELIDDYATLEKKYDHVARQVMIDDCTNVHDVQYMNFRCVRPPQADNCNGVSCSWSQSVILEEITLSGPPQTENIATWSELQIVNFDKVCAHFDTRKSRED